MIRTTLRFSVLVFLLLACVPARADHLSAKYLFAARLNGTQEVPATLTSAVGVGTFQLNNSGDTLCITVTVNGLSGPITGAHIHEAAAGANGPIVKDLVPFLSGSSLQATLAGSALSGLSMAKMFAGGYYINVHTAANPGGEIRGQILLEEDRGMLVKLSGTAENPPVTTTAKGLAFFMLSQHNQSLSVQVVLDSLNGPITGAHLHRGVAGSNGPIIQDLMPLLSGNVISGKVDPTAYLSAILADSVYINVHTSVNPSGLVRGQLHFEQYLHFDARMTGAQEAPPVSTSAQGLGVFRVNYAMDSVWYDLLATGLSGPITASHIHRGAVGVSGPVLVPFPSITISGSSISGFSPIPAGSAGDSLKRMMLEGELYANIHTAANAPGEIRGQVYRTAREGYTFALTGDQEVPAVSSAAYGSGMVSIDRDQSNAHFMIVGTNLTPTLAHFHQAVTGVNGTVIFDLGGYLANGGIYGYWRENDPATPFTTAFSNKFRKDSVYANMHTAANPGGEIRGQVTRTLCTRLPKATTSVNPLGKELMSMNIYPNPTIGLAGVEISLGKAMQASLQITDLSGRVIWKSARVFQSGKQRVELPVSSLPAGLYFIRLTSLDGQVVRKMVKR